MVAGVTCCVIALALAWQLIAAWRRIKGWLGLGGKTRSAPRTLGVAAANAVELLRHPALRLGLFAVIAFEVGLAGGYVFDHRVHLGNEVAALVFDATGYARDLCNSLVTVD
ncbi:MAG: hypothetical protein RKL32_16910 [Gammaproteobacteria bacterium]